MIDINKNIIKDTGYIEKVDYTPESYERLIVKNYNKPWLAEPYENFYMNNMKKVLGEPVQDYEEIQMLHTPKMKQEIYSLKENNNMCNHINNDINSYNDTKNNFININNIKNYNNKKRFTNNRNRNSTDYVIFSKNNNSLADYIDDDRNFYKTNKEIKSVFFVIYVLAIILLLYFILYMCQYL